jgi:hypothetical protein
VSRGKSKKNQNIILPDATADTCYIPLSQGKYATVDRTDYADLMQWNWTASKTRGGLFYVKKSGAMSMHAYLMNPPEGTQVHHINGDGLDNRRSNLAIVTLQQNMQYRRMFKNNTSGYKGIRKVKNGWKTMFTMEFEKAEDAARAYDKISFFMRGKLAPLNFPDDNPLDFSPNPIGEWLKAP